MLNNTSIRPPRATEVDQWTRISRKRLVKYPWSLNHTVSQSKDLNGNGSQTTWAVLGHTSVVAVRSFAFVAGNKAKKLDGIFISGAEQMPLPHECWY